MSVRWKDKSDIVTLAADDRMPVTDTSASNVDKYTTPAEIATFAAGALALTFQPLDSDLTAIAALATTAYGRSLLTLANAAALAGEIDDVFVTGPASSTDNAIARFDGVTGKLVQNSGITIDDNDDITGAAGGLTIAGGTDSGDDLRLTSTSHATKGNVNIGNTTTGVFYDESNERLSMGANDQNITVNGSSTGIDLSIHNDEAGEVCQTVFRYATSATRSACWWGARSRGNIGSEAIVQSDDRLVTLQALGYDGVDYEVAAQILCEVDGTPGSNDMPGRWVFLTTPDGSVTPTEAMRINSDQSVQFSTVARPDANDGAALGSATVSWADLFLASGAVINYANGNYTITHSSGDLAFSGTVTLTNTGLHLLDTNATHDLIIAPGSNLTADRTLTVTTGDTNITLNLTDPGADRLMFWDESAGTWRDLTLTAGLTISGTEIRAIESFVIACSDETTNLSTGTAKITFRMPYAFTLTDVRASVNTAPTGSTIIVDINEAGTTILSTKLTIDASEETSTTAATPAVISDTALADDAEITIDFDQVGSSTPGKGLKVTLIGYRP